MKIKVFNTTWRDGRKNFRLEVNGVMVVDISNKEMGRISIECTFRQCLRIPELLERVYKQGQEEKEKGGRVIIETTTLEHH